MKNNQKGFGTVGWIVIVLVVMAVAFAGFYVFKKKDSKPSATHTTPKHSTNQKQSQSNTTFKFDNPKKSAHYESNTPSHGSTLAAVPVDVVLNFNFDLGDKSTLKITKDGKDYSTGNLTIDGNKLTMRRSMDKSAPTGLYKVEYDACWPDGSCHDGYFQFAINKDLQKNYQDLRNKKSVTIKLSDLKFKPMDIIISEATKVTWVNDDDATHYVNTDSHPAHTQVPAFNSKALQKGDSFSFTFNETGAYPYHCSAHASTMTANIVVQ